MSIRFAVLYFLAGVCALSQSAPLRPTAEFDFGRNLKSCSGRGRIYLAATDTGLTLVCIGENRISTTHADLGGHTLHSRSDLTDLHTQTSTAIPRPDGINWLASSGPQDLFHEFNVKDQALLGVAPLSPTAKSTTLPSTARLVNA
jgi:hypothetical protein